MPALSSIRMLGVLIVTVLTVSYKPLSAAESAPARTALDDYVQRADPTFSWKILHTERHKGYATFHLHLKSQTWRAANEVDRTVWEHRLIVVKPDEIKSDMAFLRIGAGRNDKLPEFTTPEFLKQIALGTKTVAADIATVPNQPLIFFGDEKKRFEDDLVAYTQAKFLETKDANWLARMPMVKSASSAMTAVQELLASANGGEVAVRRFVVSGGSKRGWTTWLTGAVDDRVTAIIPVVIDTLNLKKARLHRFASYGFWAPSLKDYVHHNIMQRMNIPEMQDLMRLVDPYHYRHRLKLPKYIVNASGDQFFPPDASKFYYDDLLGEKHLRYVPNANHSLKETDARDTIVAYYRAIVDNVPRPRYSWELRPDGAFEVSVIDEPTEVKLWQATNEAARDFRVENIGKVYTSESLQKNNDGVYVGQVATPSSGFRAFFVELTYGLGEREPLKFTTSVHILPDYLPFADKDPTVDPPGE